MDGDGNVDCCDAVLLLYYSFKKTLHYFDECVEKDTIAPHVLFFLCKGHRSSARGFVHRRLMRSFCNGSCRYLVGFPIISTISTVWKINLPHVARAPPLSAGGNSLRLVDLLPLPPLPQVLAWVALAMQMQGVSLLVDSMHSLAVLLGTNTSTLGPTVDILMNASLVGVVVINLAVPEHTHLKRMENLSPLAQFLTHLLVLIRSRFCVPHLARTLRRWSATVS